jgi:hypothetical protein
MAAAAIGVWALLPDILTKAPFRFKKITVPPN